MTWITMHEVAERMLIRFEATYLEVAEAHESMAEIRTSAGELVCTVKANTPLTIGIDPETLAQHFVDIHNRGVVATMEPGTFKPQRSPLAEISPESSQKKENS